MNSPAAMTPTQQPGRAVSPEELALVKQTIAAGATDAELKLFLFDCQRQGVHPLDKLLHFTKRGGKYTPITSIDFMRTRAADSGECAGSDDAIFGDLANGYPTAATVTVYRIVQGLRCAFTATARWSEYCPADGQDRMWLKMPHTMLGKCAEALALRKGFPRQLAGLYAKEELDQASAPALGGTPATVGAGPGEPRLEPNEAASVHPIMQPVTIARWTEEGKPDKACGIAVLSTGEALPVFKFTVAADCQEAQLRGYPVFVDVRPAPRSKKPYLAEVRQVPKDAPQMVPLAEGEMVIADEISF